MLKEMYEVVITKKTHDGVEFNPPMIMGRETLYAYPTNLMIEELVRKHGGDMAKVNKTFNLV